MRKHRAVPMLTLLLLLLTTLPAFSASETLRDEWLVMEQQGKPVGYTHEQFIDTDEGYQYISDMVLQLEFLGSAPSRVSQHIELTVNEEFLADTLFLIADLNGSQTRIEGNVTDSEGQTKVRIVIANADGDEYPSEWYLDHSIYWSGSFVDSIMQSTGLSVGSTYTAHVWDVSGSQPVESTVEVLGLETYEYRGSEVPVYRVVQKIGTREMEALVDSSGFTYWAYDANQGLTLRKMEKEEIPQLQSMSADALIVPSNITVNHPLRSTSSRIRVTWHDVPFADFRWEDNRQTLIDHQQTESGHEAVVSIARDERDFAGRVTLPVDDAAMASYLANSRFITPSLPEVKEIVQNVVGNEKDGWVVTTKLLEWVFEFIQPQMIPETLTTQQILERKAGKCVEYAVLFASLARAAGLPTRLALGERFQDNMWVGHMWNEVWLGEWVAVDPSHNQCNPDALLLKFVDSDTVMGTQKVRMGLIGELGITIEDVVVPVESSTESCSLKTGIEGQTYTNVEFQCQVTAPEAWSLLETSEQGLPMLVMQPVSAPEGSAVLLMFSVPAGTKPEQVMANRIPALGNALPQFELVEQRNDTVGGLGAAVGGWTFHNQISFYQENWIAINGDLGYLFVFTSPTDSWEQYEVAFERIRSTFALLP